MSILHSVDSPTIWTAILLVRGRVDAYVTDEVTGHSVLISSVPDPLQDLDIDTDDDMPELELNY